MRFQIHIPPWQPATPKLALSLLQPDQATHLDIMSRNEASHFGYGRDHRNSHQSQKTKTTGILSISGTAAPYVAKR